MMTNITTPETMYPKQGVIDPFKKLPIVTISSKFQIAIPLAIRQSLQLQPGQKFQMIQFENQLILIPLKPLPQLRGFLKGIETNIDRTGDRL
jgi:AbrB family looped-hinge helix DNA binding protein